MASITGTGQWAKYPETKPVYKEPCLCRAGLLPTQYYIASLFEKEIDYGPRADKKEDIWSTLGETLYGVKEWMYLSNVIDILNIESYVLEIHRGIVAFTKPKEEKKGEETKMESKESKVKEITAYVVDGKIFRTKEEAVQYEDKYEFKTWCNSQIRELDNRDIELILDHWVVKRR